VSAEQSKRCPRCGETKPRSEFYESPSAKDGCSSYCRPCNIEYSAQRQRENPEKAKKDLARYRAAHREEIRERNKQYRRAQILKQQQKKASTS